MNRTTIALTAVLCLAMVAMVTAAIPWEKDYRLENMSISLVSATPTAGATVTSGESPYPSPNATVTLDMSTILSPDGTVTPGESPYPSPNATVTMDMYAIPSPNGTVTMDMSTMPSPNVTAPGAGAPPEAIQYAGDWSMPNRDYNNSRASTDSPITAANVNSLNLSWSYNITGIGPYGGGASNPIILGDIIYFQDLRANVIALNRTTGEVLWMKEYNSSFVEGPNGPTAGWGKLFVAKDAHTMAALNATTGNELWETPITSVNTTGIDIAPAAYDNMVYTSTVPGTGDLFYAPGGIGYIYALDQETGKLVWNFSTVDSPDLWGHPEVNSGGGCWYTPAIDTLTGMMYWGIANPAPFPGTAEWPSGSSRPGPNLYTNSMMALDHANGNMSWFTQVAPHDLFDHDLQIAPILTSANISGKQQEIVLGAGKMGKVYAFNRSTGALLWQTEVGNHNGNATLDVLPNGTTTVTPSVLGGVETPMAYADGVVYVPVVNMITNWTPTSLDFSSFNVSKGKGELDAIDVNTGKKLWVKQLDAINVGSAMVVNDLVFTATFDGTIYAFNRTDGAQLWTYKAPSAINGWPAVAGNTIVWPAGGGGSLGNNTTPQLLTFSLPGGGNQTNGTPNVTMVQPSEGATLTGNSVDVSVDVTNFNLVDALSKPSVAGQGHIHYFIDVLPPTEPGKPAVTTPGSYFATINTTHTWENVSPGTHTFSVELANNDHTPLVPPVLHTVTVTVKGGGNQTNGTPDIRMVQPLEGATLTGNSVDVGVDVMNFNLVDALSKPSVAGQGHIHYFIDVLPPTEPGKPAVTTPGSYAATTNTTYTWQNVSPGTHTFSVELANNDHTPLVPPVLRTVTVTVNSGGSPNPTTTTAIPTTMTAGGTASVALTAQNIAFDKSTIMVPAGALVTMTFTNKDPSVAHNFAVYTDATATTNIFKGSVIAGPATTTYTFTAPSTPGTYFFRCDIHPTLMNGQFIVQ